MSRELRRIQRDMRNKEHPYKRDMQWVPIKGKETEIWGARSLDGKRLYNVRREVGPIIDTWAAVWSHKDDRLPNVVTVRFLNRWEAQSVLEEIESGFVVDPKEVVEENKRLAALSPNGWCFQGVFDGMSIWTHRPDVNKTYVIINDIIRRPGQYSLSIRWFVDGNTSDSKKLRMESLGVFDSLPAAQGAVKRIRNN